MQKTVAGVAGQLHSGTGPGMSGYANSTPGSRIIYPGNHPELFDLTVFFRLYGKSPAGIIRAFYGDIIGHLGSIDKDQDSSLLF